MCRLLVNSTSTGSDSLSGLLLFSVFFPLFFLGGVLLISAPLRTRCKLIFNGRRDLDELDRSDTVD